MYVTYENIRIVPSAVHSGKISLDKAKAILGIRFECVYSKGEFGSELQLIKTEVLYNAGMRFKQFLF